MVRDAFTKIDKIHNDIMSKEVEAPIDDNNFERDGKWNEVNLENPSQNSIEKSV